MLVSVEADRAAGTIVFKTVTGPEIRVAVGAVDVEIEMTDELAFYVRRVRGPVGEADSRWP